MGAALQRAALRSSLGKSVVFRSGAADGKRPCTMQRWRADNSYGGGGKRATRPLTWAPPTLTSPTTVMITDAMTSVTLDTTKDYILLLPGAVGNTLQTTPHQPKKDQNNGLGIRGGRNVTMIGGAIRRDVDMLAGRYVTSTSLYRAARNRAFYIQDWTGTFFIEGVYIGGQHLYETFNISTTATGAKLYVQNLCVDATVLKSPDWTGVSSHDGGDAAIQNWDGPAGGMYVDGFSVKATTYQGFFMQPTQFGAPPPVETILKHVDMDWARPEATGWPTEGRRLPWPWDGSLFGKGNKMMHFASTGAVADAGSITFSDFWMNNWPEFGGGTPLWSVNPDPSDASPAKPSLSTASGHGVITYPSLPNITGQIDVGTPPGGHWVPADTVGIGYVSPGYGGATAPTGPVAPTSAAVVAAGTPTSSGVPLSWAAVSTATGYRPEYKRTADTAWSPFTTTTGTSVTLTKLDPSTAYQARVVAFNGGGDGPVSNVVSFTTTAAVTTPPAGGGETTGAWTQFFFYDGTSAFPLVSPQGMIYLDSVNERIKTGSSGTAGAYYAFIPDGSPGPSQALSGKLSTFTTQTPRNALHLILNLDNVSDPVPANFYEASLTYVSTTKVATFQIRQFLGGVVTTLGSPVTVDYSSKTAGIEGLIMRFEHRIETDGSHTLEISYDGTVILTVPNVTAPLLGVYCGIRHYNSGGSASTSAALATIDDLRAYGKPAS